MADQTGAVDLDLGTLKRLKAEHDNEPDFIRQGHLYDQLNAYIWEFQFDGAIAALERIPELERETDRLAAANQGLTSANAVLLRRIEYAKADLRRAERVEAAAEACVQDWEDQEGYEYAEPEAALRLLLRPALAADRADLAPAPGEEGK